MNARYAKENIAIPDLLLRLGHKPVEIKKGGKEYWYRSPFRPDERTASFVATDVGDKWIWNDFGDGQGNIIDLVNRLEGYSKNDIRPALRYLEGKFPGPLLTGKPQKGVSVPSSFKQQGKKKEGSSPPSKEPLLKLITAHEIRDQRIYGYLTGERKIPRRLAGRYLLEIKYFNTKSGKQFFAFGMENKSGGHEIRAASDAHKFKSVMGGRDITVVKGSAADGRAVNVFEGMTDFLSLLAILGADSLSGDAVVMHSVKTYAKAARFIKGQGYSLINTFLDANGAGQKCTERFMADFGEKAVSYSGHILPHVDLNDLLRAGYGDRFKDRVQLAMEGRTAILRPDSPHPSEPN